MRNPTASINVYANCDDYEPLAVKVSRFTDHGVGDPVFVSLAIGQVSFFVDDLDECQRIADDLSKAIWLARASEAEGADGDAR